MRHPSWGREVPLTERPSARCGADRPPGPRGSDFGAWETFAHSDAKDPMFDLNFLAGPAVAWAALAAAITVLLAVDLAVLRGRGGTMTTRSAAVTSAVWIAISLAFCGVVAVVGTGAQ